MYVFVAFLAMIFLGTGGVQYARPGFTPHAKIRGAVRAQKLDNPIQFMLQGTNAQAIASWNQAWRLNNTYPMVSYTVSTPAAWHALPTQSFDSYAGMSAAIGMAGGIGSNVQILLYDNEKWPATPLEEQMNPAAYEQMFCTLAHQYKYACMTAPAPDLVVVQQGQTQPEGYLAQGYPQFSAMYADFYEIQAQGYEKNYKLYQSFVQTASAQAQSANPNVWVLAGLSTNPPPQEEGKPSLADLSTDIANTRAAATGGFWLNIPSPGENCPNCGPPNIGLAEGVIQAENFKSP